MSDTIGGVEMTDDEAFATLQTLADDAMPSTIPRIAAIIRGGLNKGAADIQIATEVCDYIFAGEPKNAR